MRQLSYIMSSIKISFGFCECIFTTILEKPQFYRKVIEYEGQNSFTNYLFEMNAEGFQVWLREYLGNQAALNDAAYLDCVFYHAGFAHMVKQWIKGGMKESPAFMKSLCERNIPSSMMFYLGEK